MKAVFFVALALFTTNAAQAGEFYRCRGREQIQNYAASIEIGFRSMEKATVLDMGGNRVDVEFDHKIPQARQYANYQPSATATVIVPWDFTILGWEKTQYFRIEYKVTERTPEGEVVTARFAGLCESATWGL